MAPSLISPGALVARDQTPAEGAADSNKFKSYYIIGIVIIALLVVGAVAFLLVRRWKKRAAFQQVGEDRIQALSLNVRGIMLENDEKKSYGITLRKDEYMFTENNMSESDIKPEVSILSANASKTEILEHYEAEGKLPRPFAPFMGTPPSALTADHKSDKRASNASWMSFNRHSFLSAINTGSSRSSVASFASSTASGKDKRTVRQTFNPVLPDELVISVGERMHVVTSYDDGWCIVGRDSIFKPGEVELGAVPAWCFVKPVKGLRAERPLRTASLGVTVNLEDSNSPMRDNVISWSNF